MLYAEEIVVRVNGGIYNNFMNTCEYLNKVYRLNCFYDKSAPFKYTIKTFNNEFKEMPLYAWRGQLADYNSKLKKNKLISIWLTQQQYIVFMNNCRRLKMNRATVIRCLMLKLIEETEME